MAQNIEKIKKELLERKRELEQHLNDLSQDEVDNEAKDLGDQVSAAVLDSLRQSLGNAEIEEYKRILNALQAIDEGTYGICIDCGEEISPKRLKIFPDATRCILCQQALEN